MKAMILAAGEGRRLRPLTAAYPKTLMPVVNRPAIGRIIDYLKAHGVQEIVVNAHFQYQKIVEYLKGGDEFDIEIDVRIEEEILGTGGGIRNTRDFWDREPFVVINGDVLTDIDLVKVYESHLRRNNLVTMVLHHFPVHNKVKVDSQMNIVSISTGTTMDGALAFTGIQVMNPEVLDAMPADRGSDIIHCYRELMDLKRPVRGYAVAGHRWIDIGTIPEYLRANFEFLPPEKVAVAHGCSIHADASLADWAVLGGGCSIERGALVKRSVLWNEVTVREGTRVVDSVVASGVTVERDLVRGVAIGSWMGNG